MVNPNNLRKVELIKFVQGSCKHRHKYTEHPSCFSNEVIPEHIGFLDIETTGLFANFGIILSYAIKDEDKIYGRHITPQEMRTIQDRDLLKECVTDMLRFDRVITYNGVRFDIPFLRSRCLKWGIDFPLYKSIKHLDAYFIARNKLRLHRKSMDVVSRFLGITGKTHVDWEKWQKAALQQDLPSLKEIFQHNKDDVIVLEKVYDKLKEFTAQQNRSI